MEEASNVTIERMEVADEGSDVIIPCRATQPNVTVSYSQRTFASEDPVAFLNELSTKENARNLYRDITVQYYSSFKNNSLLCNRPIVCIAHNLYCVTSCLHCYI